MMVKKVYQNQKEKLLSSYSVPPMPSSAKAFNIILNCKEEMGSNRKGKGMCVTNQILLNAHEVSHIALGTVVTVVNKC